MTRLPSYLKYTLTFDASAINGSPAGLAVNASPAFKSNVASVILLLSQMGHDGLVGFEGQEAAAAIARIEQKAMSSMFRYWVEGEQIFAS